MTSDKYQRWRARVFVYARVVLILQGLESGDVITGSTDGGTRQEPGTNVVMANMQKSLNFSRTSDRATREVEGLCSRCWENWGRKIHIFRSYMALAILRARCRALGFRKAMFLAAMWYPSKKDNDQLEKLSIVVARMIQVQLILSEIEDTSGPRLS